ncbi:DUF5675 family protein [Alcanivoracaceae bacterium MT1]
MGELTLKRFCYSPMGTFGRLELPSGAELFTVERPWVGNRTRESCIPEGWYPLRMRDSGVVSRSTGGEYSRGWEVCDVPDRTWIMIHPGNTKDDLLGCIAPGLGLGNVAGKWAVTSSRDAFRRLMGELAAGDEWGLRVTQFRPEYP